MSGHPLTGQVALVEDDYTLVLNRGAEAGVTVGMVFAVYSESGQVITDPESGRELGRLRREELRVRVFDVHPLFVRAHTFVRTDDADELHRFPFLPHPEDHVVTVNVGDVVALVAEAAESDQRRGRSAGA